MPKHETNELLEQIDLFLLSEYHRMRARERKAEKARRKRAIYLVSGHYWVLALERRKEAERRDRQREMQEWWEDLPYLLASAVMFGLIVWMIMTWR